MRRCHVRPASMPTVNSITSVAASRTSSTAPERADDRQRIRLIRLHAIDQQRGGSRRSPTSIHAIAAAKATTTSQRARSVGEPSSDAFRDAGVPAAPPQPTAGSAPRPASITAVRRRRPGGDARRRPRRGTTPAAGRRRSGRGGRGRSSGSHVFTSSRVLLLAAPPMTMTTSDSARQRDGGVLAVLGRLAHGVDETDVGVRETAGG